MLTSPQRRRNPAGSPGRGSPLSVPRRSGANDNKRLRVAVPMDHRRLARHGKNVLKLNPYFRLAGEALNVLEWLRGPAEEGWTNLGSWSLVAKCASPGAVYVGPYARGPISINPNNGSIINSANFCSSEQSGQHLGDPWAGVLPVHRTVAIGRTRPAGTTFRMQIQEAYSRPDTGDFVKPEWKAKAGSLLLPKNDPSLWPVTFDPGFAKPGQAPAFTPPVPWALNPHWQAPNRDASNGPVTPPAPSGGISPQVPNEWSVEIAPVTGSQGAPKTHDLVKPVTSRGNSTKETKLKLSPIQAKIMKAASMGTEAFDFIDVLYEALPEQYRPRFANTPYEKKKLTPTEKIKAVYENIEHVDFWKFLNGFVWNQIEDTIYGTFGKMGAQTSIRLGRLVASGLNTVGSNFRSLTYDAFVDSERNSDRQVRGEN